MTGRGEKGETALGYGKRKKKKGTRLRYHITESLCRSKPRPARGEGGEKGGRRVTVEPCRKGEKKRKKGAGLKVQPSGAQRGGGGGNGTANSTSEKRPLSPPIFSTDEKGETDIARIGREKEGKKGSGAPPLPGVSFPCSGADGKKRRTSLILPCEKKGGEKGEPDMSSPGTKNLAPGRIFKRERVKKDPSGKRRKGRQ